MEFVSPHFEELTYFTRKKNISLQSFCCRGFVNCLEARLEWVSLEFSSESEWHLFPHSLALSLSGEIGNHVPIDRFQLVLMSIFVIDWHFLFWRESSFPWKSSLLARFSTSQLRLTFSDSFLRFLILSVKEILTNFPLVFFEAFSLSLLFSCHFCRGMYLGHTIFCVLCCLSGPSIPKIKFRVPCQFWECQSMYPFIISGSRKFPQPREGDLHSQCPLFRHYEGQGGSTIHI